MLVTYNAEMFLLRYIIVLAQQALTHTKTMPIRKLKYKQHCYHLVISLTE